MHPAQTRMARASAGFLAAVLIAACSNPAEDVRIGLCKDMAAAQAQQPETIRWDSVRSETRGYEEAVVHLKWSGADGEGSAVCHYDYNAVDDTAQHLSEPLTAYSTSPHKMTLNGRTLSQQALATAVKNAMAHRGKQMLDKAQQMLN